MSYLPNISNGRLVEVRMKKKKKRVKNKWPKSKQRKQGQKLWREYYKSIEFINKL